jgi:hypothetical protein
MQHLQGCNQAWLLVEKYQFMPLLTTDLMSIDKTSENIFHKEPMLEQTAVWCIAFLESQEKISARQIVDAEEVSEVAK